MTPIRASIMLVLATLPALAAPAPAQSEPPRRVLLDDALRPHHIRLISISGEAIIYEDERGKRHQATVGGFVGLLPALPDEPATTRPQSPAPATAGTGAGVLELSDGQRFPGAPAPTAGDADTFLWSHPRFGQITVPIDSIARVAINGPRDDARVADATDDQLVLVNGDRLVGFVVRLGDPVEFEIGGDTITVPLERVSEADLANPSEPMRGMVVWLDDGSVAVVASLETHLDETVLVRLPGGQTAVTPLSGVRAIAFDAGRIRALADVPITDQQPIGARGVFDPATTITGTGAEGASDLGAPDISLPGPMRVTWDLPKGAIRLAAVAELPVEALPWGDCELVVTQAGAELMRERLNRDQPRVEFSLPVHAGAVTIAVEPGALGPINDRVVLRRPILLSE